MKKNGTDFEPIVPVSMTEIVEERIRAYLKDKKLKPGDPIPTETELSDSLHVSRNVIREALSRFRMLGLIETRKRRGMVLTQPDIFSGLERVLEPELLGEGTLREIFGMRLVIEMGIAELLFMNKTTEDIDALELIAKKKKQTSSSVFKLEQEVSFHGKLYEITRNVTLQRFQKLLLPIFQYVINVDSHSHKPGSVGHPELVELLRNGNPSSFRKGMYEHLRPHFEWLKRPVKKK